MTNTERKALLDVNVVGELCKLASEAEDFLGDVIMAGDGPDFEAGQHAVRQVVSAMLPLRKHTRDEAVLALIDTAQKELRAIEAYDLDDYEDDDEAMSEFWPQVEAFYLFLTKAVATLPEAGVCKPGIPPELEAAYAKTDYIVSFPDQQVVLKVGQLSTQLRERYASKNPRFFEWMVITACNPRSVKTAPSVNKKAMKRLYRRLGEIRRFENPECYEALGRLDGWQEESVFVADTSYKEACWLGREFEQIAVLYGTLEEPAELMLCGPKPPGWRR